MERIRRIRADQIRVNPFNPSHPWSIHPIRSCNQPPPFCLMENVRPPIVIAPLRPDEVELGATE